MKAANWLVSVDDSGVWIRRLDDVHQQLSPGPGRVGELTGKVIESYRHVPHGVGAVWVAGIAQGLLPSRDTREVD